VWLALVLSVIFVYVCDRFDILWNINLTMVRFGLAQLGNGIP
jgi:hypothetical protein